MLGPGDLPAARDLGGGAMTTRATILTAVLLAAALTGCAGSNDTGDGPTATRTPSATSTASTSPTAPPTVPSAAELVVPGAPEGVTDVEDVAVVAGDDARHLQVVTVGSSTCPLLPTDVTWDADAAVLRITLSDPDDVDGACTLDLVPTTSVVRLPGSAPDAPGLTVEVDGRTVVVE